MLYCEYDREIRSLAAECVSESRIHGEPAGEYARSLVRNHKWVKDVMSNMGVFDHISNNWMYAITIGDFDNIPHMLSKAVEREMLADLTDEINNAIRRSI